MDALKQLFEDEEIPIEETEIDIASVDIPYVEAKFIVLRKDEMGTSPQTWSYELGLRYTEEDKIPEKHQRKLGDETYLHVGKSYTTDVKAEVGDVLIITFNSINSYFDSKTEEQRLYLYEPTIKGLQSEETQPDLFQTALQIGRDAGTLIRKDMIKNYDLVYPLSREMVVNFDPIYRRGEGFDKGYVELDEIPEGIGEGRFVWFATEKNDEEPTQSS